MTQQGPKTPQTPHPRDKSPGQGPGQQPKPAEPGTAGPLNPPNPPHPR